MKIGPFIGEPPRLFHYVFRELAPAWLLENVVEYEKIHPTPSSHKLRDLQDSIEGYIRRNLATRKVDFCRNLTKFLLESNSKRDCNLAFDEPSNEALLKPLVSKELRKLRFSVHPKEVRIHPGTRADMVAYRRRFATFEEKAWGGLKTRKKRVRSYEFVGVELKTAKRSKDPLYRQAAVYTDHFAYSFSVITPLTILTHGYQAVAKFVEEMKGKGMGVLLCNKHRVLGTIVRAAKRDVGEQKRRYLKKALALQTS